MEYKKVNLNDIVPYEKNPRHNEQAVDAVKESIKQCGYIAPIIVDENMVILAGHTRRLALLSIGVKEVEIGIAKGLTEEQKKKYRLLDNKTNEFAEWDFELLEAELEGLDFEGYDFGFDIEQDDKKYCTSNGSLVEKYIAPPFSVLRADQGYWIDRKRTWHKYIKSAEGRDENVLGSGFLALTENMKGNKNPQNACISIFDPVLTETLLAWFCPANGSVIDPFAGGSVRGIVTSYTGRQYTGVDLRQEQIEANEKNFEELEEQNDFHGEVLKRPLWICGDSTEIDSLAKGEYDFMLTCPPYADLEVYSDNPKDLSNMEYEEFKKAYKQIIKRTTEMLKENSYAAIVVGEVRAKDGQYYNFVSDTIQAFIDAGLRYYNEIILVQPAGTAHLRADRFFRSLRKVVKIHQNVLVFVKGDEKKIHLEEYKYEFPEE